MAGNSRGAGRNVCRHPAPHPTIEHAFDGTGDGGAVILATAPQLGPAFELLTLA